MRSTRLAWLSVAGALALAAFAGCGGGSGQAKSTPADARTRAHLEARLAAGGYTVRNDIGVGVVRPTPLLAFSISDVDFTTTHRFWVAVFILPSARAAADYTDALTAALLREGGPRDASFYALRTERSHVYFAFTSMGPDICRLVGLCHSRYAMVGMVQCSVTAGGPPACSHDPAVPRRDLEKLIERAEAG